jgi:hypothetical protein
MVKADSMKSIWLTTRDRLVAKGLLGDAGATLSVRCPAAGAMWLGAVADAAPALKLWCRSNSKGIAAAHARVYACRPDVGAIAWGGGPFGACLADFGGMLPQVFDEQARHIGRMAQAIESEAKLEDALRTGGNALIWRKLPLCFGTTATRLALNAELFEKCAKAYVLAVAAGGHVNTLPWWVRLIANSRLAKDERRAAEAFGRGELPMESRGY